MRSKSTTISIITICYNDAVGLEKTLRSVAEQTVQPFEYFVVDGGSSDGSTDVIQRYATHITRSVSEKDRGIYDAQNKGWRMATGDYCLFLNAGDALAHERVLEQLLSQHVQHDLVSGDLLFAYAENDQRKGVSPDGVGLVHLYKDTIWHPCTLIKTEVLRTLGGYDVQYKMAADYDFFCKAILNQKATYTHVPVTVAVFDMHGVSSDPTRKKALLAERRAIQNQHMPKALLWVFRLYSWLRRSR